MPAKPTTKTEETKEPVAEPTSETTEVSESIDRKETPSQDNPEKVETTESVAESTGETGKISESIESIEKVQTTEPEISPPIPHESVPPVDPAEIEELTLPPHPSVEDEDSSSDDLSQKQEESLGGFIQATIDSLAKHEQETLMAAIGDIQRSGLPRETIASIIINAFIDKVIQHEPEAKETLVEIGNAIATISQTQDYQNLIGEFEGVLGSGMEIHSKLSVLSGAIDTFASKLG